MARGLTDQDRDEWFHNPVTQSFLQLLKESKQETLEAWGRQEFVGESAELTAQKNAKALGGIEVLEQVIREIEGTKLVRPNLPVSEEE